VRRGFEGDGLLDDLWHGKLLLRERVISQLLSIS
jgi:hypothetical protein